MNSEDRQYNKDSLISIIIPVYNAAGYIEESLRSVLAQTYKNIEVILIDDGSTDGSGEICDAWAKKDDRIRVIHKPNGGVSSARNAGLLSAGGDYIGFVDADDIIEPAMYEQLVTRIGDAQLISCGYFEYPLGTLDVVRINGTRVNTPVDNKTAAIYMYQTDGYGTSLWNKLFLRNVCYQNDAPVKMREELCVGEDEVWLAEVLGNCRKAEFYPEPLYHWMPRKDSATRGKKISDRQMSVFTAKKLAMELLPQDQDIQTLAGSRFYNDCYFYKTRAYYTGDTQKYEEICVNLSQVKALWKQSEDVSTFKRMKVALMDIMMALHFPKKTVRFVDSVRRNGIRKAGTES